MRLRRQGCTAPIGDGRDHGFGELELDRKSEGAAIRFREHACHAEGLVEKSSQHAVLLKTLALHKLPQTARQPCFGLVHVARLIEQCLHESSEESALFRFEHAREIGVEDGVDVVLKFLERL